MTEAVSIIIPTYNESENVKAFVPAIFDAFAKAGIAVEVIIVDDNSPDGTAEAADGMKGKYNVKVLRRPEKMGLSSAVIEGMAKAEGGIIGVMDADLSHPPGAISEMIKPIIEKRFDITVGSRYVKGGGIGSWPLKRMIISKGAKLLARPVIGLKDPLSGFFFFRKSVIEGKALNPSGYKIGLEIFVKSGNVRIAEIPYIFSDRKRGKSKLGWMEYVRYLQHISRLYAHRIRSGIG